MALKHGYVHGVIVYFIMAFFGCGPAAGGDAQDGTLNLQDYSGKVVIVHFWASWSIPCRRSFPWLAAMQDKYADQGLVVVGVNEDDEEADADAFLKEFPVSFATVRDADGELFDNYDLIAMPSSYVIDRQGRIVARHLGFKSVQVLQYEAMLRDVLAKENGDIPH